MGVGVGGGGILDAHVWPPRRPYFSLPPPANQAQPLNLNNRVVSCEIVIVSCTWQLAASSSWCSLFFSSPLVSRDPFASGFEMGRHSARHSS